MNLLDYQHRAARTLNYDEKAGPTPLAVAVAGLGIAGEAGEVADMLKKHVGHGHALDMGKLSKELGDVLWYVAAVATMHGLSLDEVAVVNLNKLQARYPNGFSEADSIARRDAP